MVQEHVDELKCAASSGLHLAVRASLPLSLRHSPCQGKARTGPLRVVGTHSGSPIGLLERVGLLSLELFGLPFVQLRLVMGSTVKLRREVAIAMNAVKQAKALLVKINLLGVNGLVQLRGITQRGLNLVPIQVATPGSGRTGDSYRQ